ncbi:unnamed protein product [Phytophthora lilii]|uniref:Unnamed protein product n=1 Tax=Phytophthora lilii TaxID=2077276 RepID=A0A9W7CRF6_9STRA|nr:unnamed protein product [Phytophthora lilii]
MNLHLKARPRTNRQIIDEDDDEEERGFNELVQQLRAKNLVQKITRSNSLTALEKMDDAMVLNLAKSDIKKQMKSLFKVIDEEQKITPSSMAQRLKTIPDTEISPEHKTLLLEAFTKYFNKKQNN